MKEKIEKFSKAIDEEQRKTWSRRRELHDLIREQEKLCVEDTCAEKLQKHLDSCSATYKWW